MYAAQERILFTTPLLQRVGSLSRRTATLLQRKGSLSRKWGFLLQKKRLLLQRTGLLLRRTSLITTEERFIFVYRLVLGAKPVRVDDVAG